MLYPILRRGTTAPSMWDELLNSRGDVDRLFDRVLNRVPGGRALAWAPVVDVRETADEFQVVAELPGLSPEDVRVTVEDGVLTISGEKRQEIQEGKEEGSYHLLERRYGRFERSFTLPRAVNPDGIKARSQNGVLMVSLPKAPEARARQVEIQVANGKK